MNVLIKNIAKIWTIAIDEDIDVGVARDVFIHFLDCGVPSGAEWHNMTTDQRTAVMQEYEAFKKKHYETICNAYSDGGAVAVNALLRYLIKQ